MCNSSFVGAQVLERWLTCFCWHVTWNSWIVSIEIERKFLFNTLFPSFISTLCLLRNSKVWFARAQVLERWLTCVCWHVTWNSWIVSIEIVRKCLFNTRFLSFYFHLCLLRNSKVLFARAQRREVCDPLIYCVWHVNFGWLSTNNPTWLQGVSSNIFKKIVSSHFSFCGFVVQLLFARAQVCEVCDSLIYCVLACDFWVAINE